MFALLAAQYPGEPLWLPGGSPSRSGRVVELSQPCPRVVAALRQHYRNASAIVFDRSDGADRLRSKRVGDAWERAVLEPRDGACCVTITPMFRGAAVVVDGAPPRFVTLVLHRNDEARRQAADMDHLRKPARPIR